VLGGGGGGGIRAAMQASDKIPIVMTLAADPVGSGFVTSLARPGGNLTGMSALAPDLAGKRLELLKELVPPAARVAVLWNSSNQSKVAEWRDITIGILSLACMAARIGASPPTTNMSTGSRASSPARAARRARRPAALRTSIVKCRPST